MIIREFEFITRKGSWLHLVSDTVRPFEEWRLTYTPQEWLLSHKDEYTEFDQRGVPSLRTFWTLTDWQPQIEAALAVIPEEIKVAAFAAAIEEAR